IRFAPGPRTTYLQTPITRPMIPRTKTSMTNSDDIHPIQSARHSDLDRFKRFLRIIHNNFTTPRLHTFYNPLTGCLLCRAGEGQRCSPASIPPGDARIRSPRFRVVLPVYSSPSSGGARWHYPFTTPFDEPDSC